MSDFAELAADEIAEKVTNELYKLSLLKDDKYKICIEVIQDRAIGIIRGAIEESNAQYKKALEFYGDVGNYCYDVTRESHTAKIVEDAGKRARAAIKGSGS